MKKILFFSLLLLFSQTKVECQNKYSDSLKQLVQTAKEDTSKVNLLIDLAHYYSFYNPDSGATYARYGVQLAQNINYKRGEASCLGSLCLCSTFLGNYISGLDYGLKALSIFESLHDTTMIVWTNIQIANCYEFLEDYDEALVHAAKARSLFRFEHPDSNQISVGLGLTGSIYASKNQLDTALYYERQAFAWDRNWSVVFLNMGNIYSKMENHDSAFYYYRRGLIVAQRENNAISLVALYNTMSATFESIGNKDSAIYYANKSILQSGIQPNPLGLLQASSQLAKLYELQGETDSTIKYLKAANTLKDSLFSRKKTREAQNFAFNEKLHQQDVAAQQQEDADRVKMAILFVVVLVFLLVAFFLWRNNKHKQKANLLLQQQKKKVESTLSELKSAQAQLIQSEKMASLGELTAGIAHEIQNPLNFVNNFSDVNKEMIDELQTELKSGNTEEAIAISNDIRENSEKINHHGKRADAIVKGMLQHSQTSTGKKEPTNINALTDEYLRLSYHGLRAKDKEFNATMKTDFDESIGNINIIPQDIGRVLLNLYNNAFYAINEKNKEHIEGYEPTVSVSTKKVDDKIFISVKDNGNGIPQKIVDKIFQPFFTTKPTGQGTGLGLSLSYDIVKAHGGEIRVQTRAGEGSEFIIQLLVV